MTKDKITAALVAFQGSKILPFNIINGCAVFAVKFYGSYFILTPVPEATRPHQHNLLLVWTPTKEKVCRRLKINSNNPYFVLSNIFIEHICSLLYKQHFFISSNLSVLQHLTLLLSSNLHLLTSFIFGGQFEPSNLTFIYKKYL